MDEESYRAILTGNIIIGHSVVVGHMIDNVTHFSEENQMPNAVLFDILSHKRRQYILYCLDRYQTPMALADLADEVARLEHDVATLLQIPKEDVKQIYIDLYHSHLPKMEDANLLEYSQDQDTVRLKYDLSDLNIDELVEVRE